jgi:hypothetical protein
VGTRSRLRNAKRSHSIAYKKLQGAYSVGTRQKRSQSLKKSGSAKKCTAQAEALSAILSSIGRWLVFAAILATGRCAWVLHLAPLDTLGLATRPADSCPQADMRPRRFIGEVPKGNIRLGVGVRFQRQPLSQSSRNHL